MDWLSADVATLAVALGSPGTPGHPVLHSTRALEHLHASAERRSAGSGDHPTSSMLPSLSALLGSQLASRSGAEDLAASLGNFSPREWGLDLAEPLPHEDDATQPPQPQAPGSPLRGGHAGAAGLMPRQHADPHDKGPLDLSLQRGQPLRFVSGGSSEASEHQHQHPHSQQLWQQYRQDSDGQGLPPPQPLKRKPGRPRGGAKTRPAAVSAELDGYHRMPQAAEEDPDLWNNVRRTVSSVNYGRLSSRSFDDDEDGPPTKRSRRSTARAMESAELEAMDVFGDKEDEEDRWRAAKGRSSVAISQRMSSSSFSGSGGGGASGTTELLRTNTAPLGGAAAATAAAAAAVGAAANPPKRRGRPPRDASKQVHGPQQEIERLRDELVRAHSINGRLQLQVQTLSREVLRLQRAAGSG